MNKKVLYFSLIAIISFVLVSCKTTGKVGKRVSKKEIEVIAGDHKLSPFEIVQQVESVQPAFTRAYAKKMSVYIDFKGRQLNVKASCKIVSDSAIHISIQPFFGIELFKVEMTPQNIIVVDKTNRTYYESNYGLFNNNLGLVVDYYGFQSLLSNRFFIPGKKVVNKEDFKWHDARLKNKLELNNYSIREEVLIDLSHARIAEVLIATRTEGNEMLASYDDFKVFDTQLFPQKIMIDVKHGKNSSAFYFTMEELEFDRDFVMQETNLERYKQGDVRSFFNK